MRNWDAELAPLKRLSAKADRWSEGGKVLIFLPSLQFEAKGKPVVRDALLWPHERDGYPSRLFLSERAPSHQALNWNLSFNLQGREWQSWSWKDVPNTIPLSGILAGHLRAFK